MAYIIKNRTLPGSPFLAEYECPEHGRFELIVQRDEHGDPPAKVPCEVQVDDANFPLEESVDCGLDAEVCIGTPKIAFWTRAITAINPPGSFRGEEKDPRALDTSELAEGKLTKAEWRKKQSEITKARRHAKRIKSGRIQKRIQVDSAGVK